MASDGGNAFYEVYSASDVSDIKEKVIAWQKNHT